MTRDVDLYLSDILTSSAAILEYTLDKDIEDFLDDPMLSDAVVRRLEVIGEAVKQIPEEIRRDAPDIRWKAMAGLRDVLIHGYFQVDPQRVWQIVQKDIPRLKERMELLLERHSADRKGSD